MDKRLIFGRIEQWDIRLAEVFELYFGAHKLAHVVLK